mmetsp:Transcript_15771/g.23213  ORF Transcript_15771/g.23213 Transcript_15771/m.23213 type:complete len:283 (-) Transcript_15771:223-1071(-)
MKIILLTFVWLLSLTTQVSGKKQSLLIARSATKPSYGSGVAAGKSSFTSIDNLADTSPLMLRGGACSDSNPVLFLKIFLSAALETALMLGVIVFSYKSADKVPAIPDVFGLPLLVWGSLLLVIFSSSFFGSLIDGGLSAATKQVLDPNAIPGDPNWYASLIKPSWNPPGWVFPIMWLIVSKPTQLLAVSRLLKTVEKGGALPTGILATYCAHLSLGDAWNKVFFGLQCTGRGVAVITTFYAVLLASAYLFFNVDETAGYFLLPTCGWVTVATALNWNIYLNN